MRRETVIFNICNRCNVRCRHCSNSDILDSKEEMDSTMLLECLNECAKADIYQVTLVGGEPFLYPEKLKAYLSSAKELGLKTCIITNGYWGKNRSKAQELLASLDGLTSLIVSSDKYHLEHISEQTIRNVLDLCIEMGIEVSINAVCASKEDKDAIRKLYDEYKSRVAINTPMLMPIGAAKNLEIARWNLSERRTRLPSICGIGNYLVEMNGEVHGCCNAILAKNPFLSLGNVKTTKLSRQIEEFRKTKEYQFIANFGPRGIAGLVQQNEELQEFMTQEFTCECEFCIEVMGGNKDGRRCIKEYSET